MDAWYWPNFTPLELSCRYNGEFYWHPPSNDALQRSRELMGAPLMINSAHRSWSHNIAIGGAPRSAHLYIAFDVSLRRHNIIKLYSMLRKGGFRSFGFYRTFIHVDLRPGRLWFGSKTAKMQWQPLLDEMPADIVL